RALRLAIQLDVGAIALQHLGADAFDLAQLVGTVEGTVLLSVCNDRLREPRADALQFLGDGDGIRSVDVDRTGPDERRQERDDEGGNEFGHEALPAVNNEVLKQLPGSATQECADA